MTGILVDEDKDKCPDSLEGIGPYYLIKGQKDTYYLRDISDKYAEYGDSEFWARKAEEGEVTIYPEKDWSNLPLE